MPVTQSREIAAATRLDNVRYAIRDLAAIAEDLAVQGHKILPLNIGDPITFDFETPSHLIEAVHKAMKDGKNGYASSSGVKVALEAIRAEAARKGITTVRDVFVTSGVSETVDICLTALVNPGEDILTPCPDYPLYSAILAKLGISLNAYYLNESDGWQPDLDDIRKKITPRTRAIVLINPNNPTGSVCSRRMLEQIADIAREHNLVIFSDEIYDKLILDDDEHVAMAAVRARRTSRDFRGTLQKLSCPWMAHRVGHSQWGCGRRQTIPGRHQSSVTCASMRQPPRAVCNPGRARRSTRPPQRSHPKNAQPPRPHREMVQLDPSRELCFTARSFLRLSQN
jgi:alanine-synthesizing transaminase